MQHQLRWLHCKNSTSMPLHARGLQTQTVAWLHLPDGCGIEQQTVDTVVEVLTVDENRLNIFMFCFRMFLHFACISAQCGPSFCKVSQRQGAVSRCSRAADERTDRVSVNITPTNTSRTELHSSREHAWLKSWKAQGCT